MIDLTIIIVNYNSTRDLIDCLESIYNSKIKYTFEVIVVDNYSRDRLNLKKDIPVRFPLVKLVLNEKNVGFATANNIGLSLAKGEFFLLLNPDTIIINDAITKLIEFIQRDNEIGIVGPLIYDAAGNIQYYCGRSFPNILTECFHHLGIERLFPKSRFFGHYLMTYWDHKTTKIVDLIQGSCMLMRRAVLEKIGYMDERFFLFGDDVELCYRIHKKGLKTYLLAEAKIIHKGGGSSVGKSDLAYILGFEGMNKFFKIYYGSLYSLVYRISMFVSFIGKILLGWIRHRKNLLLYLKVVLWSIGILKTDRDLLGNCFLKNAFYLQKYARRIHSEGI
ncbi:MAG: glycosyltransferase family 2 protein [Bacteroidales bacterium]